MSTSYRTTNSLLNVKTQSEGMTFSPPVWDAAALLNKTDQCMDVCVCLFFFCSSLNLGQPSLCTLRDGLTPSRCCIEEILKCFFFTCGSKKRKSLIETARRPLTQGMWWRKINGPQFRNQKGRKALKRKAFQSISMSYSSDLLSIV